MNTHSTSFLTFATEKERKSSVTLKSILAKYIYKWPVILLSVFVALAIAYGYLYITAPVYQIKATILVDPQKTAANSQEGKSVLDRIDLPNNPEVVENEIARLKSAKLINQVINDLQLTTLYQQKNGFLYNDLYAVVPVKLILIKASPDYANEDLNITIKNNKSFLVPLANGGFKEYSFDTIMHTTAGTWKLIPTKAISSFKGKTIKITMLDPDKLTEYYQKKIDVALEDKLATAVDLTLSTTNKQKGKDIINHLIEVYNADEIGDKNRETQNTIKFIDQRLASLTGELTNTEKNMENFKSSNKLTDISSDAKFDLDKLQSNDSRLSEINVQLSIIDGIEKYINSPGSKNKVPAVIGINDPSLVSSIERLSQLQLQHDQLLATTPETNPDFEQINSQIRTTRAAIKENVSNIKSSLQRAQQQLLSLSSNSESSISNLPGQERQFISIKRQQGIEENLYVYLLQKREEVSLNYASTISNYKVLDSAHSLPSKWPNSKLIYALALLVGIIFPAIVIYLRHLVKGAILDPYEIENALNVPVFCEIAYDKKRPEIPRKGLIGEQFRNLRTKLYNLQNDDRRSRVILVTSSIAGEGKSFISGNLGLTLANTGKKTIVLDLDLRRSSIKHFFKLPKDSLGITDFLNGTAGLDEIIQPSGINNAFDIISGGTAVENPSELLENGKLSELLFELKQVYNNIIIDSSPAHLVSDASIVARQCDITLYVIRQGATKKSELSFIKEILKENRFNNVQIVFNGVNLKKFGYGYEYDPAYYKLALVR